MGRPVKLSDRSKEWFRKKPSCGKRILNTRQTRQRFLIVCEGTKTEPNYFESIRQDLPRHVVHLEIYGEGASTKSLIERARSIRNNSLYEDYSFDKVWIIFDRDSFNPDDFDNAINMAKADGMYCAWSNEAFELWYILHFEFRHTAMSRTEYQARLGELLGEPYQKNALDMFQKLSRNGSQSRAIKWAKSLYDASVTANTPPSRSNPCTTVFQLVEQLNSLRPDIRS